MARRNKQKASALAPPARPGQTRTEVRHWAVIWAPWAALFAALAALHLTCVSSEMGGNLGGDNVVYYLLGKALASGQGYVDLYLPGAPAHVKYPFLFPLLLAACHALFDEPLWIMHASVALLNALGAVLAGALLGKRFESRWMGLILAAWFGTMPLIYLQSLHLLSEPLYLALAFGALMVSQDASGEMRPARFAGAVLLALGAYFTRSAGVALAAALMVSYFLRRVRVRAGGRTVDAAVLGLAVFAVCALAWALRNHLAAADATGYLGEFMTLDPSRPELGRAGPADLVNRSVSNLIYYAFHLGGDGVGLVWRLDLPPLGWALLIPLAAGVVNQMLRGCWEVEIYFIISLAIILVWPFKEIRFLVPVIPLAGFYVLAGCEWGMARLLGADRARTLVMAAAAAILITQLPVTAGLVRGRFVDGREPKAPVMVEGTGPWTEPVMDFAHYDFEYRDPERNPYVALYTDYVIINRVAGRLTPPGAILMSRKPMWTYYLSDRHCVPLTGDPNPFRQRDYMKEQGVDYVVMGLNEDPMLPLLQQWWQAKDGHFRIVAEIPRGRSALLEVNPTPR